MKLSQVRGTLRAAGDEIWGWRVEQLTPHVSSRLPGKGFTHNDSLNPHNHPVSWAR